MNDTGLIKQKIILDILRVVLMMCKIYFSEVYLERGFKPAQDGLTQ